VEVVPGKRSSLLFSTVCSRYSNGEIENLADAEDAGAVAGLSKQIGTSLPRLD
jgi:hypothetical protein